MNFWQCIAFIFYISLTLLMVNDYFPDSFLFNLIPIKLNIWIILSLYLLSIISKRFRRSKNTDNINGQILSIIYLFFVMLLLNALGGKSASGIGLGNIGVWITLGISVGEIFAQKRKSE